MKEINGWNLLEYEETGSTNDEAKKLSLNPAYKKYIVTALRQTGGRGRRGRNWVGLEGNLFMSLAMETRLRDWGAINFITGLSLLQTIKSYSAQAEVRLKWPNDVLVNDCKISGILLEKGEGDYLIIGVGVNIKKAPEVAAAYRATSLKSAGIETDRTEFLRRYMSRFDENINRWREQGFVPVRDEWLKYAKNLGGTIAVHTEREDKEGIFFGVDDNAALRLQTPSGIEKIYAGDVFYVGKENE